MTASIARRLNVTETGRPDGPVMVLAHGFGCDQEMWRRVLPALAAEHRVVLFDLAGVGGSDPAGYDTVRHSSLDGYATDLLELCDEMDLREVIVVGHSMGATTALAAAARRPDLFARLVLVAATPCCIDDPETGYTGGFSRQDIDGLLESLDSNYFAFASSTAAMAMANPDSPELAQELEVSFCQMDTDVARRLAGVAFLSDVRPLLSQVSTPSLLLQATDDVLAPPVVGDYLHAHLAGSTLVQLAATGHLPHVSAPEETATAILDYLRTAR